MSIDNPVDQKELDKSPILTTESGSGSEQKLAKILEACLSSAEQFAIDLKNLGNVNEITLSPEDQAFILEQLASPSPLPLQAWRDLWGRNKFVPYFLRTREDEVDSMAPIDTAAHERKTRLWKAVIVQGIRSMARAIETSDNPDLLKDWYNSLAGKPVFDPTNGLSDTTMMEMGTLVMEHCVAPMVKKDLTAQPPKQLLDTLLNDERAYKHGKFKKIQSMADWIFDAKERQETRKIRSTVSDPTERSRQFEDLNRRIKEESRAYAREWATKVLDQI